MIRKLHINNYKSLHDLTLEVGRFNVFIGENGCGKSNLLEAIALAAAAAADKLDNEFLRSRGIRATKPQLMRSAFNNESLQEPVKIGVGFDGLEQLIHFKLNNDNQAYGKWTKLEDGLSTLIPKFLQMANAEKGAEVQLRNIEHEFIETYLTRGRVFSSLNDVKKSILQFAIETMKYNEDQA